ncbi:SCO family protein [Variovorax sp. J22P240]|uniref:SCO family protein n=1 Tax=unclassified Variovorax TaxID=663243 RepID=UPI002576CBE6|nr:MULTISPECIES: SCO family protein [unclassified Variovorax]MDM0002239.1 SCO family protein [Variovorax sp. J22P240]MDM0047828.1 SCO family protein [Variovorax sp. J22R115]
MKIQTMPSRRHLLNGAIGVWLAPAPLLANALTIKAAPDGIERLPVLGPAPHFALESATGTRVTLADLRGKVLLVTFVFTTCSTSCPILVAKLAELGRAMGREFGTRYAFVAITVDPLTDTPARLRTYAASFGADTPGWYFLTGAPKAIDDAVRGFGSYAKAAETGGVDHLFLTSLVDRAGMMRVQYMGTNFNSREMQRDLQMLASE